MSDLQLDLARRPFLIGFAGHRGATASALVDHYGNPLPDRDNILVWGPYVQPGGAALRWRLSDIVPAGTQILEDPADLFLHRLIEVELASQGEGPRPVVLSLGGRTYYLPFDHRLLDLSHGAPIQWIEKGSKPVANTISLRGTVTGSRAEVELWLPLRRGRFLRTQRTYDLQSETDRVHDTPRFAVWPDFQAEAWTDYFFYEYVGSQSEVELEPWGAGETRDRAERPSGENSMSRWWRCSRPLAGLIARNRGDGHERGLLLGPFVATLQEPRKEWHLSVDFGSTHTRLFVREGGGAISELPVRARAVQVTGGYRSIDDEFFRLRHSTESTAPPLLQELPTQVVAPRQPLEERSKGPDRPSWSPVDGVAVLGRLIKDFHYNSNLHAFSTDIKWAVGHPDRSDEGNPNERANIYLSHVLWVAKAEAMAQGARLASASHAHPSAFPTVLQSQHQRRWRRLLSAHQIRDGGAEAEAAAAAAYLTEVQRARAVTGLLAIDVGGSTSDIAIWQDREARILESVRFAASAISAWLCRDEIFPEWWSLLVDLDLGPADWFAEIGASKPEKIGRDHRMPFIYVSLEEIERLGLRGDLLDELAVRQQLRPFLQHASFVYGSLLYYLGLLWRGLGSSHPQTFKVHFCGKGSAFLDWLRPDKEWEVLEKVFLAGIHGPSTSEPSMNPPQVEFLQSLQPKHEVGHGRLVRSIGVSSGAAPADRREPRPVRVGERGYSGLDLFDQVTVERMAVLVAGGAPAVPEKFPEFDHFLEAWSASQFFSEAGAEVRGDLRDHLIERLMGAAESSWASALSDENLRHTLTLDPLFLFQCKAYHELANNLPPSIWHGLAE